MPIVLGFVSVLSLFFFYFLLFKHIISSKVMDEPLYTIVTLFLRVFGTLVVHPSLNFMKNECFLSSSSIMFEYI